ncbi:MAG: hypothetical protein IH961_09455, partial [Chloroflexi bacterium]|nr:hypothetical protein [Chloroflexota bacterium]
MKTALLTAIALSILAHCPASAEGTAVRIPNPSFETAAAEADAPHGWRLSGDEGVWLEGDAADGQRAVAVAGTGQDASYWRTEALELKPHTTYRLTFEARRLRGQGGTPMTGPVFCNRDLGHISQTWEEYSSIFLTPTRVDAEIAWLRFGQSHLAGAVAYDDVALVEVQ